MKFDQGGQGALFTLSKVPQQLLQFFRNRFFLIYPFANGRTDYNPEFLRVFDLFKKGIEISL